MPICSLSLSQPSTYGNMAIVGALVTVAVATTLFFTINLGTLPTALIGGAGGGGLLILGLAIYSFICCKRRRGLIKEKEQTFIYGETFQGRGQDYRAPGAAQVHPTTDQSQPPPYIPRGIYAPYQRPPITYSTTHKEPFFLVDAFSEGGRTYCYLHDQKVEIWRDIRGWYYSAADQSRVNVVPRPPNDQTRETSATGGAGAPYYRSSSHTHGYNQRPKGRKFQHSGEDPRRGQNHSHRPQPRRGDQLHPDHCAPGPIRVVERERFQGPGVKADGGPVAGNSGKQRAEKPTRKSRAPSEDRREEESKQYFDSFAPSVNASTRSSSVRRRDSKPTCELPKFYIDKRGSAYELYLELQEMHKNPVFLCEAQLEYTKRPGREHLNVIEMTVYNLNPQHKQNDRKRFGLDPTNMSNDQKSLKKNKKYRKNLKLQIEKQLEYAVEGNYRDLIYHPTGCGGYKNPPNIVAKTFKQVIESEKFAGKFDSIYFAMGNTEIKDEDKTGRGDESYSGHFVNKFHIQHTYDSGDKVE